VWRTAILLWILALLGAGDPAPEVDLVGALELPQLLCEAQGLLVRRDSQLGHVPLTQS